MPRERVGQLLADPAQLVDLHGIPRGSVVPFDREIVGEGMWSAVRDRLSEAGPHTTLWQSESDFTGKTAANGSGDRVWSRTTGQSSGCRQRSPGNRT